MGSCEYVYIILKPKQKKYLCFLIGLVSFVQDTSLKQKINAKCFQRKMLLESQASVNRRRFDFVLLHAMIIEPYVEKGILHCEEKFVRYT